MIINIIKTSFIFFIFLVLISGCINIKSKYTPPKIYSIQQSPLTNSLKTKIQKNIFVKQFNINAELETNRIVISDGNNLQYFNYHLWALPLDELLTNYIVDRFSNYNVFEKGIVKTIFNTNPDYVLEGNINSFKITKSNIENNVEVTITIYLYKYSSESKDYQLCFSNNYSKTEKTNSNPLEKLVINLDNIISEITDNILQDIIEKYC